MSVSGERAGLRHVLADETSGKFWRRWQAAKCLARRALERLKDQSFIEAVCDILLERDLPRL
jgi:hypothetical protein